MLARTIKIGCAIAVIALFFAYVLNLSPLTTVSPDSIRFMHYWQTNVDQFKGDGWHTKNAFKAVFFSLRSSNSYDLNRGRLVQYWMYGIDGLTRWLLPSPMINIWMILLLTLNAALIAWVSTSALRDLPVRLDVFCLGWVVLVTSALVISPAMLLILYAKYLWVTFVLAFFLSRRAVVKVGWLVAAVFSDEIGLFAAMVIMFFTVIRFVLAFGDRDSCHSRSPAYRIARAFFWGVVASIALLFVYYGISAVVFNVGATGFRNFTIDTGQRELHGLGWWTKVHGLLWRAEVIVLGSPLGHRVVTWIVGSAVFFVILAGGCMKGKAAMQSEADRQRRPDDWVLEWLGDERVFFYTFWIAMLMLITLIVPGDAGDFTHYNYPAAAVLSVLLVTALVNVLPARLVNMALVAVLAFHLVLLPRAVATTDDSLGHYLFPDGTVSREDINAIKRSVMELKTTGSSTFFDDFNNGQEIDFSGTWFYSRIKGYGDATGPYFPVQGTVRVLLWPARIGTTSQ